MVCTKRFFARKYYRRQILRLIKLSFVFPTLSILSNDSRSNIHIASNRKNVSLNMPIEGKKKRVFAHYMVCCPSQGASLEGMMSEIKNAQAAGIDGFVLNCGGWLNGNYKVKSQLMFEAAENLNSGFKLFFSLDGCCNNTPQAAIDMVVSFSGRSAQFFYENKVVLSSWSAGNLSFWKDGVFTPLRKLGYDIFFVPFFFTETRSALPSLNQIRSSYDAWWNEIVDGLFYFGAAGLPEQIITSSEAYASVMHDAKKLYMAPVCPLYWGRIQANGRRYFEFRGGEGLALQWNSIIFKQDPEWVELITWNDFNESYICPGILDDVSRIYFKQTPFGFFKPHAAYLELCKYYIQWYKTGIQPSVETNAIFFFYRTHSKHLSAPFDQLGPVTQVKGDVEDIIYLTIFAEDILEIKVSSGSSQIVFQASLGINHYRVPFLPGEQQFEVFKKQVKIIDIKGEPISSTITHYNYFMTTGYAKEVI